jgi:hypothetical protein
MIISLADAVAQAIGTEISLTTTIRVDVCRRQDPRANAIVVTPFFARTHEVGVYADQALQVAIYHSDLEAALDLAEQLRAGITEQFGETDGRFCTWTIAQAWEAVHVRIDPAVYAGTTPAEKSGPEVHKITMTLYMLAKRIAD